MWTHIANQAVSSYIQICNWCNTLLDLINTFSLIINIPQKDTTRLNQLGYYWLFSKKITWFKPSSPYVDLQLMQLSSWSHWHVLPNYFKYSWKRKQASKQVSYYWISSKKEYIVQTKQYIYQVSPKNSIVQTK